VTVEFSKWETTFTSFTVAPFTTAPEGSRTMPESEVELLPWALAKGATPSVSRIKMAAIIPARPLE
jgi:hypothetical protein